MASRTSRCWSLLEPVDGVAWGASSSGSRSVGRVLVLLVGLVFVLVLQRRDGITMSTHNPGHFERMVILDKVDFDDDQRLSYHESLLRKSGPFFVLDHGVHAPFSMYDAVISACAMVNGISLSGQYPCGCGTEICDFGYRCDEQCSGNNTAIDSYVGSSFGDGGCCIGPAVSPQQRAPTTSPGTSQRTTTPRT
ncbi:unnamed protein product [Prorocentrum cordatum]|uniref:Uncharacterized protein n=1 Tax=Prorocentrum cordatum TaxID=2364126 RepID=A0ABN9UQ34_9DINO|nr:unnamed protein product [Polarella glacialis]